MLLTKSLPKSKNSKFFSFTNQRQIETNAKLLAEYRQKQKDRDRLYSLIHSFLIYDHYAHAFKAAANVKKYQVWRAWVDLATEKEVQDLYTFVLSLTVGVKLGDISIELPVKSVSELYKSTLPKGIRPGSYRLKDLSCSEFIGAAWKIRCNLLHGSYNPNHAETWKTLAEVTHAMSELTWQMVCHTPF